jgi:hypothetical protein
MKLKIRQFAVILNLAITTILLVGCSGSLNNNSQSDIEKGFCEGAKNNEVKTTEMVNTNRSDEYGLPIFDYVQISKYGFNQNYATKTWFNLPDGDLKEFVKQYTVIDIFENKAEERNIRNAISAYCQGKFNIDISIK